MKTLHRIAATSLVAAVALLGACGTTEPVDTDTDAGNDSGDQGEQADDPITVTDGRGEEVTLPDGPAENVVALEWAQIDMVVSLGVDPVGVADPAGYQSWAGTVVPLRNEPVDVGIRREPSIDAVVDLEPDLIVGVVGSIPDEALEQMERIAPIVLFQGADADDPIGHITSQFETMAELLGKQTEAQQILDDFDAAIDANGQVLADAGLGGTPVVLTSPFADGANLTIRMHGPRTAPQQVAELMGLEAAWTDPGDDEYGLSNTDVEGLTGLPEDTALLYWGNDDSEDVVETEIDGNPVWESLPFVEQDRVYRAAVGVWVYGGPASLTGWSDDLTEQLTN